MSKAPDPRLAAVRALERVLPGEGDGASLREVLARGVPDGAAGGLMRDLCFGVCRHLRPLNQWLNGQLDKPLKPKAQAVRLAVLCGLYELWFTERPAHAVVNAYPELCRQLKAGWASGLINALLRKADGLDPARVFADYDPAVRYSLPGWLWRSFQQDWPEQADDLARAALAPPPFTLRVNRRQQSREQALAALGDGARPGDLSPWSLYLSPPRPVSQLPGFDSGGFSVQDEAAQLPVEQLAAPDGGRVLDACAAPAARPARFWKRFPTPGSPPWTCPRAVWTGCATPCAASARKRSCYRATPPSRPPGGTANPSTPSCSTRPVPPAVFCAASRT